MKNHAVRIHEVGGPEVLRFEEVPIAQPQRGEVIVRQTAIGLNYIDTYHRSGLYPVASLPTAIGMEASGVVEALGVGVSGLAVGDRVAYAGGPLGAYAERRAFPGARLVKLPSDIDDITAAAMMLKGMTTAYLILQTYPVKPGQTVLFHAAAGGVGLIACQWLRHLGVTVIGTVGSDEKAQLAREHGCTHAIVYRRENFVDRVREITGAKGVPVVYDSVGASTFPGSLDCLSPRGMFVSFGNASGPPPSFDLGLLSQKGALFATRPTLMAYTSTREELIELASALFDVVRKGIVQIRVHQTFSLAHTSEAHRALESRKTTGSTILIPSD